MNYLSDLLLTAAALGAAVYCAILSRRLKALGTLEGGVGGAIAGGRSFLGLSTELRGQITERISLVGFYDFGAVDSGSLIDTTSPRHAGAGIGVRYALGGFGPVRLDLAWPVSGSTGDGLQFYIGIGQAF